MKIRMNWFDTGYGAKPKRKAKPKAKRVARPAPPARPAPKSRLASRPKPVPAPRPASRPKATAKPVHCVECLREIGDSPAVRVREKSYDPDDSSRTITVAGMVHKSCQAPASKPVSKPAPRKPSAPKTPARAGSGWVKQSFSVVHRFHRTAPSTRVHTGEVLLPDVLWGVSLDSDGRGMLIHLPSGALLCDGPSMAALKKAAEKLSGMSVGPGWASTKFVEVAKAVLAGKGFKEPPWWGDARDAVASACP